ncbi:MFS general substrate transporter [Heliocybe sulcata]|uniref:MFS general substrate transporter n=1 Tax=Heliocybe sulcata TaxID=5364 RepID=A0A5C3MTJ3_9AGAM|nr:MFS general substrate transporter [Heliocybe sulcata]
MVKPSREETVAAGTSGSGDGKDALEKSLVEQLDKKFGIATQLNNAGDMVGSILTIATLFGLAEALKLEGTRFNVLIAMMRIGHMISPVRLDWVRNKVCKSHASLPGFACAMGVLLVLLSVFPSYPRAICILFLLGIVDAALEYSLAVLIRSWYTSKEVRLIGSGAASANIWAAINVSILVFMAQWKGLPGEHDWWSILLTVGTAFAIYYAPLVYWRHPRFPETAAWPTQAERALLEQRSTQRSPMISAPDPNARLTFSVLRNATLWKHALLQMPSEMALTYATFWPVIVAGACGVEKMTPGWLLASACPWIVPALLRIGISRKFRTITPEFMAGQLALQWLCSLLAFVGFGIASLTTHRFLLVPALVVMPLHDIGRLTSLFAFVSLPPALFSDPSEIKSARFFSGLAGSAGTLLGTFLWPVTYEASTYKIAFGVQAAATLLSTYAVHFCVGEIRTRRAARSEAEEEYVPLQVGSKELDAAV